MLVTIKISKVLSQSVTASIYTGTVGTCARTMFLPAHVLVQCFCHAYCMHAMPERARRNLLLRKSTCAVCMSECHSDAECTYCNNYYRSAALVITSLGGNDLELALWSSHGNVRGFAYSSPDRMFAALAVVSIPLLVPNIMVHQSLHEGKYSHSVQQHGQGVSLCQPLLAEYILTGVMHHQRCIYTLGR